jgi:hypothetical protein
VAPELQFESFSELQALPVEPDWLWEGFLVPGSLTLLASRPFAGKSTLVSGLLKAIEEGSPFLGRQTKRASAAVVSEEDRSALRMRADRFGLHELQYLCRSNGALSVPWPVLIAMAAGHAVGAGHSLLVVDTFTGLAGLAHEQENDAGAIAERLRPLQEAAGRGLAVLFLHHMNALGQPRGSTVFRAAADIAVRFYRQGNRGGVRLETDSRLPTALPSRLDATLIQDDDGWFYRTADREEISPDRDSQPAGVDDRLWEVLVAAGPEGLTYSEIDRITDLSADIAKRRLPDWFDNGRVSRHGEGTRGSPYHWVAITD